MYEQSTWCYHRILSSTVRRKDTQCLHWVNSCTPCSLAVYGPLQHGHAVFYNLFVLVTLVRHCPISYLLLLVLTCRYQMYPHVSNIASGRSPECKMLLTNLKYTSKFRISGHRRHWHWNDPRKVCVILSTQSSGRKWPMETVWKQYCTQLFSGHGSLMLSKRSNKFYEDHWRPIIANEAVNLRMTRA